VNRKDGAWRTFREETCGRTADERKMLDGDPARAKAALDATPPRRRPPRSRRSSRADLRSRGAGVDGGRTSSAPVDPLRGARRRARRRSIPSGRPPIGWRSRGRLKGAEALGRCARTGGSPRRSTRAGGFGAGRSPRGGARGLRAQARHRFAGSSWTRPASLARAECGQDRAESEAPRGAPCP
jgi:hypothetical protein